MKTDIITVAGDGLVLSQIIWRRFRRPMIGMVERVLDMPENYGLADLGPVIPVGTRIVIPIDDETATSTRGVVQLWE